ncbi:MAG: tetratricopeptide repeat protein [Arenicellales bacterium]
MPEPGQVMRVLLTALAGLLASGCILARSGQDTAAQPGEPQVEVSSDTMGAPVSEADLPKVKLTGDLLYDVLLGEIAAGQGDMKAAASSLLDAARASRDYRLAERATRIAMDAKQYDVAFQAATLWSRLEPKDEQPQESMALVMAEQGRIDEAEAKLVPLINRDPSKQGVELHRVARLLGELSNQRNALAVMKRLVEKYKDDADAYFAQAFLADRVNDDKLVMESLDRALTLRPDWEEAALAKLGHLIQNKYPRKQVDDFAQSYLKKNPKANRVRISYGRYLIDQEADDLALTEFEAALKYEPENTTALMAAGLLSVQADHYDKARKYFVKTLKLTPDNDQVRLYLGQIAEDQKHYGEAEKWYREITDQDQLFTAQLHLATVISELKGVDAALEHLDTVQPDDEDQFVRIALTKDLILRDAHDLKRAKTILDEAVARYPENTDLLYAHGLLEAQLDNVSAHEKDMRAVLAEDPNNAQAMNALGYTLADLTDRFKEAYQLISKALSMRPDDPFILDSMGWVQYRMGNRQDAIQYLEKAFAKRDDPEIAAHLGEVLWVTGQKDKARQIWGKAKKADPDNDTLNKTIERFTR